MIVGKISRVCGGHRHNLNEGSFCFVDKLLMKLMSHAFSFILDLVSANSGAYSGGPP